MDSGILKHADENQLYYYAAETYIIATRIMCTQHIIMAFARNSIVDYYYITLPLQGRHKHLASRSIHVNRIHIPSGHLAGHRSAR